MGQLSSRTFWISAREFSPPKTRRLNENGALSNGLSRSLRQRERIEDAATAKQDILAALELTMPGRLSKSPETPTLPELPTGVPPTFQEHLKLLMDLQVLASQAEITRVSTLMFARELSTATYPETTIRYPFHNLSHHSNDRGNMDRFAQLNTST